MQWSGQSRTRVFGSFLLSAVALFVWLTPVPAAADEPFATFTAWEIQEFLRLKGGTDAHSMALRFANATLVGDAMGGMCTPSGQDPCGIDISATSRVNLGTGTGPLQGRIHILFDQNPGSPLLSDLVLAAVLVFRGTLDLTPILNGTAPVALTQGTWTIPALGERGTFTGVFLIPIPPAAIGGGPCSVDSAKDFMYFNPAGEGSGCLTDSDFSLGAPVTKLLTTLERRARHSGH